MGLHYDWNRPRQLCEDLLHVFFFVLHDFYKYPGRDHTFFSAWLSYPCLIVRLFFSGYNVLALKPDASHAGLNESAWKDSIAAGHAEFYVRGDIFPAHDLHTSPSHLRSALWFLS